MEALEERCLLSAATTVPSPFGPNPFTALGDLMMVSQARGDPSIVFLGDSILYGYEYGTGASVWDGSVGAMGAADYGVPGQTTQTLLWQLSIGQLLGVHPSVVVLMIGTNNLLAEGDSPQATAAGIVADVAAIHAFAPQADVLVLGVPPGQASPSDPYRAAVSQTNSLASQMLAGDPRAQFLDVGSIFLQPDGSISPAVLFDYIHPTAVGYAALTNAIFPSLEQAFLVSTTAPLV